MTTADSPTGRRSLATLPTLRESLEAHGLSADKRFGQHFLLDLNITRKIARMAGPLEGRAVLEVGPGPGGLTRALLEGGAERVVAIERDPRFLPLLSDLSDVAGGRLIVVEGDALTVDHRAVLAEHAPGLPAKVVANLPYNVGTPLLVDWLKSIDAYESLHLMFQREVADRIVAVVGHDAYGRLAVLSQAVAQVEIVMDLPARAFTPPPKVDSAVVRVVPLTDRPGPDLLSALERLTAAGFGQRRKMLRSSLKPLGGAALCEAVGLSPTDRAEVAPVSAWLRLAEAISS